ISRRPLVIAGDSQPSPDRAEFGPPQRRRKRDVRIAAVATLVLALITATTAWFISARAPSGAPAAVTQPPISTTPSAAKETSVRSTAGQVIQLKKAADSAKPFETVRIRGIYHGGSDTILRLQCWEDGKWLAFPLPTKTDRSGQFTAYVEFGQPGRYRLRLLDPDTGVMSKPLVLAIKG
ncbi:MAG TPA: hypothetical protein VLJ88_04295, partial [Propionibacteriaceae bacterium]|nr:hypothetical protein [Propionibacteriaceae bacterium]